MKNKIAIINSDNASIVDSIQIYLDKMNIAADTLNPNENLDGYSTIVYTGFDKNFPKNIDWNKQSLLNIYPSILPLFADSDNPLKDSFLSGMKVAGITVHKPKINDFTGEIISQYPVLLGNDVHFDDFYNEIINLCKKLYPIVIYAITNNTVFDFYNQENHCAGGCNSNCKNCHNCQ